MSFVSGLLGGSTGAGFQAAGTNVLQPTTTAQAGTAYGQQQAAQQQQQAFVNALGAQGNMGMGTQSALTQQLGAEAQGQGPNPAQAQLAQNTAANTANQAALMAGQRGASSNAGLIGREAAQQGAATQQQSVGQAATLQAQQQLAAQQQLQNLAQTQVGQQNNALNAANQTALAGQQNILGGIQGQNQSNVAMQSNQNSANAGIANTNAGSQAQGIGGLFGAAGSAGSMLPGLLGGAANPVGGLAANDVSNATAAIGGAGEGGGAASGALAGLTAAANQGGVIQDQVTAGYADGGPVVQNNPNGPQSFAGRFLSGQAQPTAKPAFAKGGKVPAVVSPGEKYLKPAQAQAVAQGKASTAGAERIPGKAKVSGDSLKNDTVHKTLDSGGVVIPRTKVGNKNEEAKFVAAVLAKSAMKKGKK